MAAFSPAPMFSAQKLELSDAEVCDALRKEMRRQEDHVELIASENYVSPAVLAAQGSVLTNKYAEGYSVLPWPLPCAVSS